MKHIINLMLLLGSVLPAHAQYALRWIEVEESLKRYAQPQVFDTLRSQLLPEFIQRSGALEEARKNLLRSTDVKPLKEQWERFHQDQAERRAKQFDDFAGKTKEAIERAKLDEKDPARASLEWLKQVKTQQVDFHNRLKAMPLVSLRDALAAQRNEYETAIGNLGREFNTLDSNDNSLDAGAKSYRQTLLQACLDLRTMKIRVEQEAARLPISNELKNFGPTDANALSAYIKTLAQKAVPDIQRFEVIVRDTIGSIQQLQAQERDIVRVLTQRRGAVVAFESGFNLKAAQVQFALDLDRAREIGAKLETAGDRSDMTAFLENARKDLEPLLNAFDDTYENFGVAFNGRLLPPFDRATSELFAEMVEWGKWAEEVQATPSWTILQDLNKSAAEGWGVRRRFEEIRDPEAKAIVNDALTSVKNNLESAINAALTQAQRLNELTQLQERKKMLEALGRS